MYFRLFENMEAVMSNRRWIVDQLILKRVTATDDSLFVGSA